MEHEELKQTAETQAGTATEAAEPSVVSAEPVTDADQET
jgi:hypothetical protein